MLGPKHIPNNLEQKLKEQDYEKHRKKLDSIIADSKKKKPPVDDFPEKLSHIRANNLKFQASEKLLTIDRDNQILLERLIEISSKRNPQLRPVKSETRIGKSLHSNYRKREQQRIAEENESLARRLLSQQSMFDRKKLEKEFEKHLEIVKNCQRLNNLSPRIKSKYLPPIKGSDKEEKKSGQKVKRIHLPTLAPSSFHK